MRAWRDATLPGRRWFAEHGVSFRRHYTGSLACVPSRPTLFTGQYPDVHGVTQTDGLGKDADDSGMRWLRPGEVPTLGHWFRAAGYDTYYQGKWHLSHADLHDAATGAIAGHQRRRRRRRRCRGRPLSRRRPARSVRVLRLDRARTARRGARQQRAAARSTDGRTASSHGSRIVTPAGARAMPTRSGRSCSWPASSIRTTSCCSRCGRATTRSADAHDDVPRVPPPPTADEDLSTKPAAQAAFRAAYPTGYAPLPTDVYEARAASTAGSTTGCTPRSTAPIDAVRRP